MDVNLDELHQHQMMSWITTQEALALLNVQAQTLYANVSRGKIRARPDSKDPRRSRYFRDDVLRLCKSTPGRRKVEAVATGTIEWGDPVLPSAISTVINGRLLYRGQDAVALSGRVSLEDVAALLWQRPPAAFTVSALTTEMSGISSTNPMTRALVAMALRVADDLPTLQRAAAVLREDAAQVFAVFVDALLGPERTKTPHKTPHKTPRPISQRIALAWRRPAAQDIIRRALVLLADHELNASTFATRVAISTGAAMSAGVLAGLTTLSGPLHGGAVLSVVQMVETARRDGAQAVVREQIAHGRRCRAFGHPLYPDGDCRASALLAHFAVPTAHAELAKWVEELVGERPNVDFALSAMTSALALPRHAPFTLFAIARCVGWLAHALEQAQGGSLIRPRAKYVGVMP